MKMKLNNKQVKEVSKYLKQIGCKYAAKKFKKDWKQKEVVWHEEDLPQMTDKVPRSRIVEGIVLRRPPKRIETPLPTKEKY